MRRRLRQLLTLGTLVSGALSLWLLSQSPFASPFVLRSEAAAQRALDRMLAREIDTAWLQPRIDDALAREDLLALGDYVALAEKTGTEIPRHQSEQIDALTARSESLIGQTEACLQCAWDITSCESLTLMAGCAIPIELTPVGDANALRRAAVAWGTGKEVDQLEVGLASLGLGASAAVLVTAGGSGLAKLGATSLRLSRRLGTMTPGFTRTLRAATPPIGVMVRGEGLQPLARIAGDLGTVQRNTSLPDTLLMMRHVDSAEDAARLARLSSVAGDGTRPALRAMGKSRTFRALVRLSDMARATIAALIAFALQLCGFAVSLVLRALRRQIA
ncbi:hypothetical protein CLV78_102741 [Aliiruegeria haliotis]|uniref:Uncharacterized protein n=1 Tax=Aliiruegeria haliotis TaxID=1280846 RepID=A0A2T0RWL1_9RHOB|nr:hypothetical protein [Aliiruegeria haliotis]PRY25561.1 hypothetical protein CLV78_102741 [Aliiruegeria haliotis]